MRPIAILCRRLVHRTPGYRVQPGAAVVVSAANPSSIEWAFAIDAANRAAIAAANKGVRKDAQGASWDAASALRETLASHQLSAKTRN